MRARDGTLILAAAVGNFVRGGRKLSQQKKRGGKKRKTSP
jgi:hypothetical protein